MMCLRSGIACSVCSPRTVVEEWARLACTRRGNEVRVHSGRPETASGCDSRSDALNHLDGSGWTSLSNVTDEPATTEQVLRRTERSALADRAEAVRARFDG